VSERESQKQQGGEGVSDAAVGDHQPGHLLGAIFSATPDAVVVIDASGTIVLSNPAVTALFGYFPEELIGEPIEVLIPSSRHAAHANHVRGFFEAPRSRQMGEGLDLAGRHRDGSEFAVEVSLTPVEVRGIRFAAAFVRDGRERRRELDRASVVNDITQRILAGEDPTEILPLVAGHARQLSRAQAVWVVTPSTGGELTISSVDGPGTEVLRGVALSGETSRSAEVMRTGESEVIDDLSRAANVPSEVVALDLGPGLYVPLVADTRRLGTLVLGRIHGEPQFERIDVAFAEVFASAIASAIESGEVRAELERLGTASDRERIAFDLHDTVIQHLFAIGMSLQAARTTVSGRGVERIDAAIGDLDDVIREIRNTIFRLPSRSESARGLRDEMFLIGDKFAEDLGFQPRFAFHGPVDAAVPAAVSEHLLQVLTEGLSNTARHAHATSVEAIVDVESGSLKFSLLDDGIGVDTTPSAGEGLRNISLRATNLGGSCTVSRREPSGTIIEWIVPL
jgi:two-component system sensor histidine kinase DevS